MRSQIETRSATKPLVNRLFGEPFGTTNAPSAAVTRSSSSESAITVDIGGFGDEISATDSMAANAEEQVLVSGNSGRIVTDLKRASNRSNWLVRRE